MFVMSGVIKNPYQIYNHDDIKTAKFFGYNIEEWSKITLIEQLMPEYLARVHNTTI